MNLSTLELVKPGPFTPDPFYIKSNPFQNKTFDTKHICQTHFTSETFHSRNLAHQLPFALLDQTFLQGKLFTPKGVCTRSLHNKHLLHQIPFTPSTFAPFCTRDLLYIHQKPSTPAAHLKHFTPNNFLHQIFLHQEPFTADPFYTKQACKNNPAQPKFSTPFQLISFTSQDFCIHLHQAILTPKNQ